ncbi:MAG TPA: transglutaminase-like domain-containing protein, partial [Vicinamibacteria bacterium]
MLLMVAMATLGAAALGLLRALPGRARFALAAALVVALLAAGFLAAGLQARLLLPRGWGDLLDGVDRGLGGVRTVDWPYTGDEHWVRLTILLGAPLLLAVAAALAFWPARRGAGALRGAGLVTLLLLYGIAATEHNWGKPVLRGFALLLLVAAWLWLPRLHAREALAGATAVLAVGIVAIPFSVELDGRRPWWDYRSFDWFGGGKVVSFDWRHSYGPLDWPRDGTTLLNVRSAKPHYWKAETLDLFDGYRWERAGARTTVEVTSRAYGELPSSNAPEGRTWDYFEFNPAWDAHFRVNVRALRSDLIVGAGTTRRVIGAGTTNIASDGTAEKLTDPLEKGDSYDVEAYVPTPTAAQMRGAPPGYAATMAAYTTVYVPRPGDGTLPGGSSRFPRGNAGTPPPGAVFERLRGEPGSGPSSSARRDLMRSPYGRVYRLASRLTAGRRTVYDAVKSVETYLKRRYRYNERPPTRAYPLPAFLFRDKAGYCQQFSGAMALMLRLAGIPARVATGFTRGSYNRDTGEYRVRDLDAHSWVEVQFTGIGWVAFDPTPAATPAEGQSSGLDTSPGALAAQGGGPNRDAPTPDRVGDSSGRKRPGHPIPAWLALSGLAVLGAAGGAAFRALSRARALRALPPPRRVDAQLAELRRALTRLGWSVPAGTTLIALERRLRRAAGPASAAYAATLRANRYDPHPPAPPGPSERRALRRELGQGGPGGLRGRLRALAALPPKG